MRALPRIFVLLFCMVLVTACDFRLRGQAQLKFSTLYLAASPSPFVADLREALKDNGVKLTSAPKDADVILEIVSELPDKQILSLSGAGAVNEFRLRYIVSLHAYDNQQREWIPEMELEQSRNFTYSDTAVLAKEGEEALLWKSMRSDMVQQILRRLSRVKPKIAE